MQTVAIQEEAEPISEAEYTTLEQTLMESDRGRRFLAEFVKRNKTPESLEILGAIQRLEKVVTRQRKVPDLDRIRLDIADMHEAIERTKNEIANIKAEDQTTNRFIDASHELDAIVSQTEGATQVILESAEKIQEQAWTLREAGASDEICNNIDEMATEIFMACSFQDLTGQRTNKVVQVLRYLESRINLMINIWGIDDDDITQKEFDGPKDERPDAHLLNGPQMEGKGVSQTNVDELMSVDDAVFSAALAETSGEALAPAATADDFEPNSFEADTAFAPQEPMDASAIDEMFSSTGSEEDMAGEDNSLAEFEASHTPDEMLDKDEIDKLFDNDPVQTIDAEDADAGPIEETAEAEADADWEHAEAEAASEDNDPLADLSEAERQALFN
ncbi:hypothetical protein GCM10011316_06460 [Roseibium aquae]|uniref:Chemotaxis protein CheZ n=1 Tax=Roseibium aquae TaxID=1323746 RepID=A0A916T9X0_9HYPH|nr:protein phosphatase CheZ [Roseibium aquae]GGB37061.1 hypothetical protein GCM10011316_06460 [Roseibium aquae]